MRTILAALMSAALTMALSSSVLAQQKADGMANMDMSKMPAPIADGGCVAARRRQRQCVSLAGQDNGHPVTSGGIG